ncbi:MAG TPA: HAMP domain-containing protein [Candidatus Binatia bacterium]|jgi:HAMP domain-containing protein
MTETPIAPRNGKLLLSVVSRWHESLKWRIAYTYGALIVVLGLFVVALVYQSMSHAARTQIDRRIAAIAGDLSDAAAGLTAERELPELRALVARYGRLDGVAYVFVENRTGGVRAHSLKSFPLYLQQPVSPGERGEFQFLQQRYDGENVYEARAPILNGQWGSVHLGFWSAAVDEEVRGTVLPVVALVAAAVIASLILVFLLAHGIIHPIRQLTDAAGKISTGDLETPIFSESKDEVGELARSLERMRASLKAAIWRLSRAN